MLNLNLLSRKALSFGGNYDRSGWNFWRGTCPRAVRWAFTDWDFPGMRSAVRVDGIINNRSVVEKGWTGELACPWTGMKWLAKNRSLPPKEDDVWNIFLGRFEKLEVANTRPEPQPAWCWTKHGTLDTHLPEKIYTGTIFQSVCGGSVTRLAVTRSTIEDFNSFAIQTSAMEVSIIPELGGQINSLRISRTGREWLRRHPRFIYKRVPHVSSYTAQSDTGGWDECFPSVAECEYLSAPWQGAVIQGHGELWSQTAQSEINEQADTITLLNRWGGIVLPYTFTPNITITENSARRRMSEHCVPSCAARWLEIFRAIQS
jgi:hypothetical protein